jgi:nucleotide-binding universal stress UspA family protein
MQRFNNILFVSHGVTDETEALKQALSLARNNKAELKAVIVCPDFPKEMTDYKGKYESSLIEQLQASIRKTREAVKVSEADVPVQIEVESGDTPAIRIIRHVIKGSHDLIIKEAEPKVSGKGFMAMDMELLRKSPCPVWLTRPISRHRNEMKVAVAIDPESMAPEGHDLSLRLLELSRSLADTCNGELNIISCWDYPYENTLRNNVWIKVTKEELRGLVHEAERSHRAALDGMIQESKIGGALKVHHVRGRPDLIIPDFLQKEKYDILVMGTVARTGIYSFVIGNTAENILQKLECSLLALKPNGFVSPVKAY